MEIGGTWLKYKEACLQAGCQEGLTHCQRGLTGGLPGWQSQMPGWQSQIPGWQSPTKTGCAN